MHKLLEALRAWPDIDTDDLRRRSEWEQARKWGWIMASGELQLSRDLKRHVLTTLLDASAAHHGACLGIIARDRVPQALKLINPDDAWDSDSNERRSPFMVETFNHLVEDVAWSFSPWTGPL